MILTKGKVKDKEHLKLRCLVQVGPGLSRATGGQGPVSRSTHSLRVT